MEFRILGPLEVVEDGQALDLGGQKQRALLAVLLLHRGEVVSVDRLIEALWPERPPATAAKALQVHVSQLRKSLGKARLTTKAPGYQLRVEPDELDIERCRRLVEEGRPREALALWRGSPLSEFAYEPFAHAEIARLEELKLATVEDRVGLDLASGRHAALVGELEALVADHPLRELFRAQLMLALYRSGRQAEALDVYQSGRSLLADELGLEPGEALKTLQKAILAHDPSLDLPAAEEPPVEPHPPPPPAPADVEPRETRKTVTVLFAALESPAGTDSLDPEAERRLASRAFSEISTAVEHHGGTVETLTGDTLTAVFGVPVAHEDDAGRAVRATVDLRRRLTALQDELGGDWADRLDLRLALSTGEVVTGGMAAQLRSTGRPIALAARLGQSAGPGELLLDEATHRLVRDAVDVEPSGEWLRLLAVRDGSPVKRSRFDAPMVGRERERRRLHDSFEQAVGDRSCQLFTVLGSAGVGKSRLVQEFVAELGPAASVVRGRCLPYGKGITFFPLMEAVQEAAGLEDADSEEVGLAKVAALLEDEPDADLLARRVSELVGISEIGAGAEESFAAVRILFESIARRTPLVIVFDDIHWGEATFLDLVEYLADWIRDAPVLAVAIARPELLDIRPGWSGGKLNATSVLLEPLSDGESALLVEQLGGGDRLPAETRQRIVEAAEGNPLFVEEMLALVLEVEQPHGEIEVPPTIHALLAARLDRLDQNERAVLELAAVQGKEFSLPAVATLAPETLRPAVDAALATLVRKQLVRPDRTGAGRQTYRFRHLLIRDAGYESIPKEARAEMHERFGRWLEQSGSRTGAYEEIVGYHLEQAYLYRAELGPLDGGDRHLALEAAERLGSAAKRAFTRRDVAGAVNLISRAATLLPRDDPSVVDLVPTIRAVQGLSGDLTWAERALTDAVEASAGVDDRRLETHALVQRALLRLFTRPGVEPQDLLEIAEQGIPVFEDLGDDLGLARAWRLAAQAHYLERRAGPSAEASQRALEFGRRAGNHLEVREIVEWLCVATMLGPTPAPEMGTVCEGLLPEVRADPILEPTVLAVQCNAQAMQGNRERATELLARWRDAVQELGDSIWLLAINFGFVLLADDPVAAEAHILPGYEALLRLGEKSHYSSCAGHLARAKCGQGDYAEALRLSEVSESTARPNDIHSHMLWRMARAEALAHQGELETAAEVAREVVGFAADSDFLDSHGDALLTLSTVLRLCEHRDAAAAAAREAEGLYRLKGNTIGAARARVLAEGS